MLPLRGTLVQHETETSSLLAPNASVPRNSCSARDGNILTDRAKCFRSAELLFSMRRKHPHCWRQMLPFRGTLVQHETETSSLLAPNASLARKSCSARDGNILTVRAKCFPCAEVLFVPGSDSGNIYSFKGRVLAQLDYRGIAYSVAAHTRGTCRETCAADPLCTGAVYSSESCSTNSSV